MQVKKFEARSMKEALEMVKRQLGPDAIILSARDNRKSFGLVGDVSVEVTAAVAEETLQKKRFTESRMRPDVRERFLSSPARTQRRIMEEFVQKFQDDENPARTRTSQRYIEIDEEKRKPPVQQEILKTPDLAQSRIRGATQRALEVFREPLIDRKGEGALGFVSRLLPQRMSQPKPTRKPTIDRPSLGQNVELKASIPSQQARQVIGKTVATIAENELANRSENDFRVLRSELEGLRQVITDFQKVPQNFVGQHPGALHGLPFEFSASFEKLIQAGIAEDLVVEMLEKAQESLATSKSKSRGLIDGWTAKEILDTTLIASEKSKSRLQCFVGPRGSGKTSSLVKMASHAVVDTGKRVAILTADTQKVGAIDQMRIYSQILNVPFGVVRKPSDWLPLMRQLVDYEMIFCDFPGLSLKTIEEISIMKGILAGAESPEIHVVLSTCFKDSENTEFCRRYEALKPDNYIFNHLDEALVHGTIFNVTRKFKKPLHSFGIGPRVPEDFEFATKERVLDLIFKLSKLKKNQESV